MNWVPLDDKVIVEVDEAPDKVGQIILPDSSKQVPQTGKVLAVGPGKRDSTMISNDGYVPMYLKEGHRVVFGKYAGMDFEIEKGHTVKIMRVDDILAYAK